MRRAKQRRIQNSQITKPALGKEDSLQAAAPQLTDIKPFDEIEDL